MPDHGKRLLKQGTPYPIARLKDDDKGRKKGQPQAEKEVKAVDI